MQNIRNFCIIAHIDHGKSTLADRFLELTGTIEKRKMKEQVLDQMELERERGITIKLQPVTMNYKLNGRDYQLNLIDTPGHVDFSYEVSRSLAAVEGAILLVDATKGVQAQTLANLQLALNQKLTIVPALNKIDLPSAKIEEAELEVRATLESLMGEKFDGEVFKISGKTGQGVAELLEAVIAKVSAPQTKEQNLQALIFDSAYDAFKGVIAYVRLFGGEIKAGQKIKMAAFKKEVEVLEVGLFRPMLFKTSSLGAGQIGYVATGLKDISFCRVGDTIVSPVESAPALPGYKEPSPMVFASFYPAGEDDDFDILKDALAKLSLSDSSLTFELESSEALGRGFKCGFLGMLHLEIVSERLKREYSLELLITTPSVAYEILEKTRGAEPKTIKTAQEMPDVHLLEYIKEPWVKLEIITPASFMGAVMKLAEGSSCVFLNTTYLSQERVVLEYEVPLREIIVDFYDKLKSVSSGYASMSYELIGYREADLVRLDVLIAGEMVEAFSRVVPKKKAESEGRALVERLKEIIPKQMFAVALQAVLGGKIIARETISAMRKDVTGYLYGGDVTRKRKLLEKQKKGKKKMKTLGKVNIPQDVFLKALKK